MIDSDNIRTKSNSDEEIHQKLENIFNGVSNDSQVTEINENLKKSKSSNQIVPQSLVTKSELNNKHIQKIEYDIELVGDNTYNYKKSPRR